MTTPSVPRFLEVDDLTAPQLRSVLERALAWKTGRVPQILEGRTVAALFEKPSARTRTSFEAAVASLGGHPITLRPEDVGMGVRETVADVARTLACYCAAIGARVFDHTQLEEMAAVSSVPVVNLLSDCSHPLQAVADLLTILEHTGKLEGRRLAYIGDGNNVAASLAMGAALTGMELVVASPPGYELPEPVVVAARNEGAVLELITDPYDAVRDADAVYTDVWTSMGQEDEAGERRTVFERYRVDDALMAAAAPGAVFLHCLPAHRGEEVTDSVIDGASSLVWPQAANRLHAARAVLAELVSEG
jgi:ornithine carbamoyltransferase